MADSSTIDHIEGYIHAISQIVRYLGCLGLKGLIGCRDRVDGIRSIRVATLCSRGVDADLDGIVPHIDIGECDDPRNLGVEVESVSDATHRSNLSAETTLRIEQLYVGMLGARADLYISVTLRDFCCGDVRSRVAGEPYPTHEGADVVNTPARHPGRLQTPNLG
jgi:hypothetical protein